MKYLLLLLFLPSIAFADGCPGGFTGTLETDYPDGTVDLNTANLEYLKVTPYVFTLIVGGETFTFPRDAAIHVFVTNVDCTYDITYNGDPIFHDGFDTP